MICLNIPFSLEDIKLLIKPRKVSKNSVYQKNISMLLYVYLNTF